MKDFEHAGPQYTRSHDKDMLIAGFKHDLAKAKAEATRLRAALLRIAEHTDLCSDVPHTTMGLRMLARSALEQKVDEV